MVPVIPVFLMVQRAMGCFLDYEFEPCLLILAEVDE
jgi:hypothetical protein